MSTRYEDILEQTFTTVEAYCVVKEREFSVEWLSPDAREGRAIFDVSNRVIIRTPVVGDDPVALVIGLHECGHVLFDHDVRRSKYFYEFDTVSLRARREAEDKQFLIPEEVQASQFALSIMRHHDVPPRDVSLAEEFCAKALVSLGAEHSEAYQSFVRRFAHVNVSLKPQGVV